MNELVDAVYDEGGQLFEGRIVKIDVKKGIYDVQVFRDIPF